MAVIFKLYSNLQRKKANIKPERNRFFKVRTFKLMAHPGCKETPE
jgi:hypothetical protein